MPALAPARSPMTLPAFPAGRVLGLGAIALAVLAACNEEVEETTAATFPTNVEEPEELVPPEGHEVTEDEALHDALEAPPLPNLGDPAISGEGESPPSATMTVACTLTTAPIGKLLMRFEYLLASQSGSSCALAPFQEAVIAKSPAAGGRYVSLSDLRISRPNFVRDNIDLVASRGHRSAVSAEHFNAGRGGMSGMAYANCLVHALGQTGSVDGNMVAKSGLCTGVTDGTGVPLVGPAARTRVMLINELFSPFHRTTPDGDDYRTFMKNFAKRLKLRYGITPIFFTPIRPGGGDAPGAALRVLATYGYIAVEGYFNPLAGDLPASDAALAAHVLDYYRTNVKDLYVGHFGVPATRLLLAEHFGNSFGGDSWRPPAKVGAPWTKRPDRGTNYLLCGTSAATVPATKARFCLEGASFARSCFQVTDTGVDDDGAPIAGQWACDAGATAWGQQGLSMSEWKRLLRAKAEASRTLGLRGFVSYGWGSPTANGTGWVSVTGTPGKGGTFHFHPVLRAERVARALETGDAYSKLAFGAELSD